MKKIMSYLQQIGGALMLPVAVLPAAAVLMGIGYWIDPEGWGSNSAFAAFLLSAGGAIIDKMSWLFAVGVAYGMSKNKDGAAAIAGLVGFFIVTTLLKIETVAKLEGIDISLVDPAFGKIENQFIGILTGVISAEIYNKFHTVELPKAFAFFSGKRLVPIVTSFAMIVVSGVLLYVWPVVFDGLQTFGKGISSLGSFGAGIYAFFNRLLIPVGLHHALNSVFWFDVAGINDIGNFFNRTGTPGVTGMYQAGFFPVMMFGLPAAAYAIYKNALPKNKEKIASIMIAGAFASFFTGITEPLEFSFMFVAPILYFIHAVLTGFSVFISALFGWMSGFSFSAGLVDMVLAAKNPLAVNWYYLIPQGLVFAVIYYLVFDFAIKKFNFMTPGRDPNEESESDDNEAPNAGQDNIARKYIAAAGGTDNIVKIDNCITRLRLTVKDTSKVNDSYAKSIGAIGVSKTGENQAQIVVGMGVEKVADAMRQIFPNEHIAAAEKKQNPKQVTGQKKPTNSNVLNKTGEIIATILSPLTGDLVKLDDVPDDVFASRSVGDGIAIKPTNKTVVAPIDGVIEVIFATNHAFGMKSDNGIELLVHLGIDTVMLEGKGFKRLGTEGSKVKAGDPIIEMDLDFLNANAKSTISPVIITNINTIGSVDIQAPNGSIKAGDKIYTVINNG